MNISFDDFAKKVITDVEQFEKTVESIQIIHDYVQTVINENLTEVELNQIQLKLSGHLHTLGTILSDLNNYSNAAISYRKLKRVNEFCFFKQMIDTKTERYHTDGNAGAKADQKCQDEIQTELQYLARYNKLNVLYEDTARLITSIQSFLKQEQSQAFAERRST